MKEEVHVERQKIKVGIELKVGLGKWIQVRAVGHAQGRSLVWLKGYFYPIQVDRGELVTIRYLS